MNDQEPKNISVIISYHNESDTLETTLRLLAQQTLPPREVLLIDSSSTDRSFQVIQNWIEGEGKTTGIIFRNIQKGTTMPSSSMNVGIELANNHLLAFMDCGLLFAKDWLEKQARAMEERDVLVVSGVCYLEGDSLIDRSAVAQTYGYMRRRPCVPSTLVKKKVFDMIGLFPENRRAGYDVDWMNRLRDSGIKREINEHVEVRYIDTNYASSLKALFSKIIRYSAPGIGIHGYYYPYIHIVASLTAFIIMYHNTYFSLSLSFLYLFIRGYAIPIYKARSPRIFVKYPLTLMTVPLAGLLIDAGKFIGYNKGLLINLFRESDQRHTTPAIIQRLSKVHSEALSFRRDHSLSLLLWMVFFSYSTFSALLFQKLILPMFPAFHGGSGLINADSTYFHTVAVSLAESIKTNGWSSWTLYPSKGATGNVAVLGALYAVFSYDPSLIIPLNAVIHATTGVLLFRLAQILWEGAIGIYAGIITAALFVIFPSALNWYGQVHKDGYMILGTILILYSLVRMLNTQNRKREIVISIILSICGTAAVAFVRPYNLKLLLVAVICIIIPLLISVLSGRRNKKLGYLLLSILITIIMLVSGILATRRVIDSSETSGYGPVAYTAEKWAWHKNRWIPDALDGYLERIAQLRVSNIYYSKAVRAKSLIDENAMPDSSLSVFAYLPRALQIGLFSPFPSRWFETLSVTRIVGLLETLIWYLIIPGVLIALFYQRSIAVIMSLSFSVFFLTVYGFAMPNMGTLYRLRYLYLIVFIMTGIAGYLTFIIRKWPAVLTEDASRTLSRKEEASIVIDPVSVTGYSRVGIAGVGFIVTAATLLSYLGFFIRDIFMARHFGLSNELDSFFVAMLLPMFLVSLFSMPLGMAIIPEFLNRHEKLSHKTAQQFLSSVSFKITALLALLCILLYAAAPTLLPIIGWEFSHDKIEYSTKLLLWILPLLLFSGLVIIGNSVLNAMGKYAYPSLAQGVVPLCAIGALLVAGRTYGVVSVAIGMVAGQIVNLLLVGTILKKTGYSLFPRLSKGNNEETRKFVSHYIPLVMAAFFVGATLPVNSAMASSLSPGSVSAFNLGNKFVLLVTGLVGTGIATAMLPYFTSFIVKNRLAEIRRELSFFLFLATILSIPISIMLYLTVDKIIQSVFLGGAFGSDDVILVGRVVKYGVVQLPYFTSNIMIIRYLSAFKSNRLVMIISCLGLLLNIFLNIVLMPQMGVAGISLAASISMMMVTCLLMIMMRKLCHLMSIDILILILAWSLYFTIILCLHYFSYVGVFVSCIALAVLCYQHFRIITKPMGVRFAG